VAVVGKDAREIRCAIDENRGFSRVTAVVKLVEKSPRRHLLRGWVEAESDDSLVFGSKAPYSRNSVSGRRTIFSSTAS
jgi:hypothetical protein